MEQGALAAAETALAVTTLVLGNVAFVLYDKALLNLLRNLSANFRARGCTGCWDTAEPTSKNGTGWIFTSSLSVSFIERQNKKQHSRCHAVFMTGLVGSPEPVALFHNDIDHDNGQQHQPAAPRKYQLTPMVFRVSLVSR